MLRFQPCRSCVKMPTLGSNHSIFITGASIAVHDNGRRERARRRGAHGGGEELADEEVKDVGVGEGHERRSVVQVAGSCSTRIVYPVKCVNARAICVY